MNMNEEKNSTKKYNFIISLIGTGLLCLVIGYLVGIISLPQQPKKPLPLLDKEQIIQQTKNEIKNRLIEGRVINPEPEEIFALGGTVKEVGENYLVVVPSIKQNPFGDTFPETIKILTDENTQIKKWALKNIDVFKQEMQEYQESPNKTDQNPPNQYILQESQLSNMEPGNYILLAESESNIKGAKEFLAKRVEFSEQILHLYDLNP